MNEWNEWDNLAWNIFYKTPDLISILEIPLVSILILAPFNFIFEFVKNSWENCKNEKKSVFLNDYRSYYRLWTHAEIIKLCDVPGTMLFFFDIFKLQLNKIIISRKQSKQKFALIWVTCCDITISFLAMLYTGQTLFVLLCVNGQSTETNHIQLTMREAWIFKVNAANI